MIRKKVIRNKFVNLSFIHNGHLKQMRVRGNHGWEGGDFAKKRNRGEQGDRDHKEEDEKWRWREND
jgi:hypothetical protein